MTKPSPRLDALRALREAAFAKVKTPKAPRKTKAKAKAAGHIVGFRGDESIADALIALRPSVYGKEKP